MGRAYERIERIGRWCFWAACGAVVAHGVMLAIHYWVVSGWLAHAIKVGPCLTLCATILPALVVCLNGFRYQAECRRLKERAAAMFARLQVADRKFKAWDASLDCPTGARAWGIAQEAYGLAELAINEVADWRVVYRHDIREA
jgi:hypothetical protein